MSVDRRLVAIVVADVVGYSRLMERDEAGTHERLRKLRDELIDPKIAKHGGRIVKTSGDGMLLEFPSATSALRCAVEIQRELGARNLYVAADEKIELRIGVHQDRTSACMNHGSHRGVVGVGRHQNVAEG